MADDRCYDTALRFVLAQEGGFVDDTQDSGGPTNLGITRAVLSAWLSKVATTEDVRDVTFAEASAIYRTKYWDACRCGDLPPALALVVFDTAVNSGVRRSFMFLQSALEVPADGEPGPQTIAAAQTCDIPDTVRRILALRLAFLEGLKAWSFFGVGWQRRLSALETLALAPNGGCGA